MRAQSIVYGFFVSTLFSSHIDILSFLYEWWVSRNLPFLLLTDFPLLTDVWNQVIIDQSPLFHRVLHAQLLRPWIWCVQNFFKGWRVCSFVFSTPFSLQTGSSAGISVSASFHQLLGLSLNLKWWYDDFRFNWIRFNWISEHDKVYGNTKLMSQL